VKHIRSLFSSLFALVLVMPRGSERKSCLPIEGTTEYLISSACLEPHEPGEPTHTHQESHEPEPAAIEAVITAGGGSSDPVMPFNNSGADAAIRIRRRMSQHRHDNGFQGTPACLLG
jgi:hypothetical protein